VPDLVQDTFTAALEELHGVHDDVHGWSSKWPQDVHTRHRWRATLLSELRADHRRTAALPGRHRAGTDATDQPPAHRPGRGRPGPAGYAGWHYPNALGTPAAAVAVVARRYLHTY